MPPKKESKVEQAKKSSRHLRGTIAESLGNDDAFGHDDSQLLKFHGVYQQQDRDAKKAKAPGEKAGPLFMVRCAIPGGVLTADQYLNLDSIADDFGRGSLRITTRQGIQFHWIQKSNLKATIARVNRRLLTTLSACGDVERNVMACPAPLGDAAHVAVSALAREIAEKLRPGSRAYHEIWLDEEKVASSKEEEPFYGEQYLPRKFKTGIALDTDNCIDVYNYDCGLIAVVEGGAVRGFHILVGGGMGMTHERADTFARIAEPLGFIAPDVAVETVRTVAAIFRDHGNRADRKHARLKYLLEEWGIDRFRSEFRRQASFPLEDPRPLPRPVFHDHLGRHPQGDGKWIYGLFIQNGRIQDTDGYRPKSVLRSVVEKHRPGVRLTSQQDMLLTDLTEAQIDDIESILRQGGLKTATELSSARRNSMACPALPTCGLAITEAERVLPSLIDRLEVELDILGLRDVPMTIRMTGCPNGCARPYTADIALVGRKPGERYNVYVGGGLPGDRVADLWAADVPGDELIASIVPLLRVYAGERNEGESVSDYYQRKMGNTKRRWKITGSEQPTKGSFPLPIAP